MRRLLIVLGACMLGLIAAFAFAYVAGIVRPCSGEQLSCSMTVIVGIVYIPVFSIVAALCFSVAALWKNEPAVIAIAGLAPIAVFVLFAGTTKFSEFSVREFHEVRERDIQELLQVGIPVLLTMIVPWIVLQWFASRAATEMNIHG
jgi:hypothetical protein